MLRIFVTGDNHIGLKYTSHEQASVLAAARTGAFEAMVRRANEEGCGLFVITGDLFENTYGIPRKDVRSLLEVLSRFHGTVAVLPGNHDYYDPEAKVWQYFRELMASCDNLMLLADYRPYKLTVDGEDVVLYPALCTSLHCAPGQNNLGWIKNTPIPRDGAYHIGIAHGAVEGETIDREGRYFLMKRQELEEIPVDVWLIGHTHVPFPHNLTETYSAAGRIFNAGTHVQTDVSCNTDGQCFVVEVARDKTVRAKKVCSGNLRFYRRTIHVTAGSLEQTICRELNDILDNSVVDLVLEGAVTAEEYENRAQIVDNVLSRFVEGTCSDYSLSKQITRELIVSEFPETSLSAALLTALMDDPKEAQLAYELVKSLKEGK